MEDHGEVLHSWCKTQHWSDRNLMSLWLMPIGSEVLPHPPDRDSHLPPLQWYVSLTEGTKLTEKDGRALMTGRIGQRYEESLWEWTHPFFGLPWVYPHPYHYGNQQSVCWKGFAQWFLQTPDCLCQQSDMVVTLSSRSTIILPGFAIQFVIVAYTFPWRCLGHPANISISPHSFPTNDSLASQLQPWALNTC